MRLTPAPRAGPVPASLEAAVRRAIAGRVADYARALDAPSPEVVAEPPRRFQNSVLFPFQFRGSGPRVGFVVKDVIDPSRPTGAVDEYHNLEALHPRFAGSSFRVPQPLDCFPELNAIVTERVFATTLLDMVGRGTARWRRRVPPLCLEVCHRAGAWLIALQRHTGSLTGPAATSPAGAPCPWHEALSGALERSAQRGLSPALLRELEGVLTRRPSSESPESRVHSDYSPQNVFFGEDLLYVIDFAEAPEGVVEQSAAFFWAHLELAKRHPLRAAVSLSACQAAFEQGFQRRLSRDWQLWGLLRQFSYMPQPQGAGPAPARLAARWLQRRKSAWAVSGIVRRLRDVAGE